MGLLGSIRAKLLKTDKLEVDYGLEKLIIKAERIPIYYNWYDFHVRGKLTPLDIIRGNLEKQIAENRLAANKKRFNNKKSKIHRIFDPVVEKIKRDLINEKNPKRAERILAEYSKAEKIVKDDEIRAERWALVGDQILCSEYNIPTRCIEEESVSSDPETGRKIRGKFTALAYYSEKSLQENFKALHALEMDYAKYNHGQGLIALKEAAKKIDDWQQRHEEKWKKEQRFQELLSGTSSSDSPQSLIDKIKIPGNRRPVQAHLSEIYNEKASKAEAKEAEASSKNARENSTPVRDEH